MPPLSANQNSVWQPPHRHQCAQRPRRGPQRLRARGKGETKHPAPPARKQRSGPPEQSVSWVPHTAHLLPPSPEEGPTPLCPPSSELGWGESWNPEEVQQHPDTITQEGQTSFESLIFKSENLENSATSPLLTAHHPLKRKASCRLTQTQTSLSQRRTYPLRSGPLLRQLPTLSENRERGRRIRDICWLLHPSAQLDRSSPFWKWPKYIFIWILF